MFHIWICFWIFREPKIGPNTGLWLPSSYITVQAPELAYFNHSRLPLTYVPQMQIHLAFSWSVRINKQNLCGSNANAFANTLSHLIKWMIIQLGLLLSFSLQSITKHHRLKLCSLLISQLTFLKGGKESTILLLSFACLLVGQLSVQYDISK